MAIKHSVVFDGISSKLKLAGVKKLLTNAGKLYSGSVQFKESSYVFNCVNCDAILYIVDEIKKRNEESQIEIQTYANTTEKIQPESFDKHKD